ncbi:hypothetical protein IP88_11010 [alpha proteobacterium AAP81b]|nr:hypothetical protein IP88_11010 [alpha proteobacterium AAP81b]
MRLLASLTSPYARKLRVIVHELGLPVELVDTAPLDDGAELLAANPLGKVPALLRDGLPALVDSPVIARYLLSLSPGQTLLPPDGEAHWQALQGEAIVDGILDAAIIMRFNALQGVTSGLWIDRQRAAIARALAVLAERVGETVDYPALCTVIACEYLDLRWPDIAWRDHAALADLHARLAERPSLAATRPPV